MRRIRRTVLPLAAAAAAACTRGESQPVDTAGGAAARREVVPVSPDLPDAEVRATRPAYRGGPVAGGGTVSGTVALAAPLPAEPGPDSAALADPGLARACGAARRGRFAAGSGADGAVVWLEGVAAGKPMPVTRRYELTLAGCALTPRTLAAAAGGTLNVHGVDPLASRLVFVRAGAAAGDEAGRVLLRTTMSAPGQLVPDEEVLAKPGLVEVRGERPAWLRAWVLAFDQPYFAAVDAAGAFTLGDVPPGRYQLVAWHPRAGRVARAVEVGAGQAQGVALTLPAGR